MNKKLFNTILVHYFNDDMEMAWQLIETLKNNEIDLFWSYASKRLITREDTIKLSNLLAGVYH
jgi:hypothetical protein